jgi:hypothetical protein
MKTFEEFVADSAQYGSVNLIFEAGMYSLGNDLEKIVKKLRDAWANVEVAGGVAVNAHILPLHRSRSFVTRDIDILVYRDYLERVAKAAEALGYRANKMMGGYALIRLGQELGEAIHLLFSGEKSKSTQALRKHPTTCGLGRRRAPAESCRGTRQGQCDGIPALRTSRAE